MATDHRPAGSGCRQASAVLALLHRICKDDGITAVVSLHQLDFAQRAFRRTEKSVGAVLMVLVVMALVAATLGVGASGELRKADTPGQFR